MGIAKYATRKRRINSPTAPSRAKEYRRVGREQCTRHDIPAVLRLLAECGPIPGADAAGRLGWSLERWWAAIECRRTWWTITGKGWVLTAKGRAALETLGA